jgi:anti-sigma B factor antagonist
MTAAPPPPADSLDVVTHDDGSLRVVRLSGSAGTEQVAEMERQLRDLAEWPGPLVLDLSGLRFVNSAGLGAMIAAHRRCRECGGTFCVAGPQEGVANILHITHLDRLFSTHPDVESARRALAPPSA